MVEKCSMGCVSYSGGGISGIFHCFFVLWVRFSQMQGSLRFVAQLTMRVNDLMLTVGWMFCLIIISEMFICSFHGVFNFFFKHFRSRVERTMGNIESIKRKQWIPVVSC